MTEGSGARHPIALLLLAAGRSRRFGRDKLAMPIAGRPLCQHTALAFAGQSLVRRIAVVGESDHGLADMGFECLRVPPGEAALSASIAPGMRSIAEDPDLAGVLIALGDMPLVASRHVRQLIEAFDGSTVASAIAGRPQPPALFGRRHFPALQVLEGDAGAHELLRSARHVEAEPATLFDIDTPEDFTRLSTLLGQAKA